MRGIGKNIALAFTSALICLLILEGVVRFVEPREIMRYFFLTKDPILDHRFIPRSKARYKTTEFDTEYRINSLGLRDDELTIEKPPNTFRILILGDSFTEGIGVNSSETFSKRLQTMLDTAISDYDCQVVNAGVGSYSPLLEYIYLSRYGLQLDPDLVILNFDLSDVYDDIQYTYRAHFNKMGVPIAVVPEHERAKSSWFREKLVSIKDFFKEHTRLYNFIRVRLSQPLEPWISENSFSGDIRYDKYAMLRENYPWEDDRDWALSYKYILLIQDTLSSRGIEFWVTVYPYGLQISPREWSSGRRFWGFKADTIYSTKPQEYMESFCRRNRIPVINMCDDFRAASRSTFPLYLDYNGHWTAAGHEVAAKALFRELKAFLRYHKPDYQAPR